MSFRLQGQSRALKAPVSYRKATTGTAKKERKKAPRFRSIPSCVAPGEAAASALALPAAPGSPGTGTAAPAGGGVAGGTAMPLNPWVMILRALGGSSLPPSPSESLPCGCSSAENKTCLVCQCGLFMSVFANKLFPLW